MNAFFDNRFKLQAWPLDFNPADSVKKSGGKGTEVTNDHKGEDEPRRYGKITTISESLVLIIFRFHHLKAKICFGYLTLTPKLI